MINTNPWLAMRALNSAATIVVLTALSAGIGACDDADTSDVHPRVEALAEEAGLAPEDLREVRPPDAPERARFDEAIDIEDSQDEQSCDAIACASADELTAQSDPMGRFCTPAEFQSCRDTCGIFDEYCFVCVIADDDYPVFYCRSNS
jgi:hypothetical protein